MSAIVRRPGGALVPYTALDRRQSNPDLVPLDAIQALADVAEPFRDEYCAIADQIPGSDLFFGGPLNRTLINRNICGNTVNPRPPIRGQCVCARYQHRVVVFGFNSAGAPLRSTLTPGNAVYGPVTDMRIVPSGAAATRWQVEALCLGGAPTGATCNPMTPPSWHVLGSTDTGFNRALGGSVESWYSFRIDGQPDNCAIVTVPPPIVIPPGQPIFTLPRIESRFLPDVEIEVRLVESPSIYPTFELNIDGALIEAQFTLEGIEFNFPGADFDLDTDLSLEIANQVNNNLQLQLDNQTTAIELSLQGQITQQNNFIEEQNNELEIELANTIENAIEIALGDVTVDVDLSPVLIELDIIQDLLDDPSECPELDLTPVLDKLNQLDEKYSERLDNLEQSLKDKIDDAVDKLECYLQAIISRLPLRLPDNTSRVGGFTSTQSDTVTTISLPTGILAVGVVITEYDKNFIRIYKVDDSAIEVEGGFGHVSLVAFNGILDFVLMATRRQTLAINPDVPPSGIRLSLKPGVTVDVFATAIAPEESVVCE